MTDHQLLIDVHRVLRNYASSVQGEEQAEAERLRAGIWDLARSAREYRPTVFAMYDGDLWLGPVDKPSRYIAPNLRGIQDAYAILFSWGVTQRPLNAEALRGSPSGNALHGRLARAADWIERYAGCRDLAVAIRGIEVSRDGFITPPSIPLDWIKFERF